MADVAEGKVVYFVRHGQSEGNIQPIFQSPKWSLSGHGRMQATNAAERVARLHFDTLISSPYPRAKETAQTIAEKTGHQPEFSELFTERIRPPQLDDAPHGEKEAEALYRKWSETFYTPGKRLAEGENFDDIVERIDAGMQWLAKREEESFVVVTHNFFLRSVVARVLLGDLLTPELLERLQRDMTGTENTGITAMKYISKGGDNARWRLWIYNDHAHLG